MPDDLLTIGELARRTARRPSAIRYYEQIGLLPAPARVSGRRRYPESAVRTLTVVNTAQRAGLTLGEIRMLLATDPGDADAIEALRSIAESKLPELEATIAHAELVRRWLEAAARCECPSLDDCRLFEPGATPPR
jgi:MerR family transcriptional regulator, redox-sensitive transcriptional activator SoxR